MRNPEMGVPFFFEQAEETDAREFNAGLLHDQILGDQ